MKLNGRMATVNIVTEMFIREGQEPLVFKASAIMDTEDFSKYIPEPKPPLVRRTGESEDTPDYSSPKYQKEVARRGKLQTYWMIIKSLQATPGLTWEIVKIDDPTTWDQLDVELKDFGLSNVEKSKLIQAVMRANSLDERFIEAAKERFTRSQLAEEAMATSSQQGEPSNTKSGALVNN